MRIVPAFYVLKHSSLGFFEVLEFLPSGQQLAFQSSNEVAPKNWTMW